MPASECRTPSTRWSSGTTSPPRPGSQEPAESTYLHDEAGGGLPLKEHLLLPLVGAQVLLLSAYAIAAINDNEDIGICTSGKDITGVDGDLVRNN